MNFSSFLVLVQRIPMQERGGDEVVNAFEVELCFEWGLDVAVQGLIHNL